VTQEEPPAAEGGRSHEGKPPTGSPGRSALSPSAFHSKQMPPTLADRRKIEKITVCWTRRRSRIGLDQRPDQEPKSRPPWCRGQTPAGSPSARRTHRVGDLGRLEVARERMPPDITYRSRQQDMKANYPTAIPRGGPVRRARSESEHGQPRAPRDGELLRFDPTKCATRAGTRRWPQA